MRGARDDGFVAEYMRSVYSPPGCDAHTPESAPLPHLPAGSTLELVSTAPFEAGAFQCKSERQSSVAASSPRAAFASTRSSKSMTRSRAAVSASATPTSSTRAEIEKSVFIWHLPTRQMLLTIDGFCYSSTVGLQFRAELTQRNYRHAC
jgi:hypothetical protein